MGAVTAAPFQRQLFIGNAGSTAATQVLCHTEINVNKSHDYESTRVNGDGTTIPIETEQPVVRKCEVKFKLRREITGAGATHFATLIAAATHESNPTLAIKVVSHSGGSTECDGDATLDVDDPNSREPEFTVHWTKEAGRAPSF